MIRLAVILRAWSTFAIGLIEIRWPVEVRAPANQLRHLVILIFATRFAVALARMRWVVKFAQQQMGLRQGQGPRPGQGQRQGERPGQVGMKPRKESQNLALGCQLDRK